MDAESAAEATDSDHGAEATGGRGLRASQLWLAVGLAMAIVTVASGIIVQHPDIVAMLCANDNMALGAVAAITQAGKADQIRVVGFDNISAVQDLVREGKILATADQHADLLAVYGIEYALEALNTGTELADKSTPVDLVTAADVN